MLTPAAELEHAPVILAPGPSDFDERRVGLRAMLDVGVPLICVNLGLTLMQVTDAWMLGHLGSDALAAVTPPGLLIFTVQCFAYGLLSAITTFVSQALGRGRAAHCGQLTWQGIYLAIGMGLASLLLWPVAPHIFAQFNNASAHVEMLEIQYFQVCIFALLPALVAIAASNFFVGVQRNRFIVLASVLALTTNAVLNYGLIFGHFGLPELGFAGAAYGTVGAATVECVLLMAVFLFGRNAATYGTRNCTPNLRMQWMLLRVGIPAAVQSAIDAASWGILLTWLVAFYGTVHQAAATVLVRCMQVSFLPSEGIAVATLTLVGNAVGAGRPKAAERAGRLGFCLIAGYMTLMGGLMYAFRFEIMEAFSSDPEVIAIGASAMIFVSLLQLFDAMNVTYAHALQGAGDTLWPSVVNVLLVTVVLAGGGVFVVRFFPELGSQAIWALTAFYVFLVGTSFRRRWAGGRWKRLNLLDGGTPTSLQLSDEPVAVRAA